MAELKSDTSGTASNYSPGSLPVSIRKVETLKKDESVDECENGASKAEELKGANGDRQEAEKPKGSAIAR